MLDRVEILLVVALVFFHLLLNLAVSNIYSKQLDLQGDEKKQEFKHGPISSLSFLRRLLEKHYKGLIYLAEFVEVNDLVFDVK